MSQILTTGVNAGKIVDSGVAQESPAHQFLESTAHQRQCYPVSVIPIFGFGGGWNTNWFGSPPVMRVSPSWDAMLYLGLNGTPFDGFCPSIATGSLDAHNYNLLNPSLDPFLTFSGTNVWSADATGSPHWLVGGSGGSYNPFPSPGQLPSYGTLYAWLFSFGNSITLKSKLLFAAGAVSYSLILDDTANSGVGGINGMNSDFVITMTLGSITITGSMASGWSGTGISSNTSSGSQPNKSWTANFNNTFATNWGFSSSFGPMSYYSGNTPKVGAGSFSIG